ncbi:tRNA-binding protein [Candidatus Uhrbacteria bacterium RIFCSPLOWO2_12_FULL_46_10]|uniref:tRNA-binding protein n=1 Tax=Candidatus Uhrbacteria bacterium RIFCSPLOWO2_01_FULL_47_25 TaxID=1802402 RepID=A0A1F7UUX8_9BACT|nr:MAG: Export-related chaperone CsaA [Parcubacteria group bacterium GW2011_GWA2_46_9]OGL60471.1 MAG: tRNA-binding protein [Candidatus Uhrbacteria bacterium RIFCSPHIGHO2_01_FULL_46_23]OGL67839.1 MAG: tRNA-binding protein [Candidatus Uhrbacteria bacterium RIFCSPHIGHO2_02_FULL_47_29]OGL75513.1 MAG: tRNA-binding protein [Candidatus Uhrbacteria bacterium RIFCSPHIGHO2_12_FULL_46_13]OGL81544.1 MAG: tRNA-binding protein [Candidatus Uhrbacteria bacterium RIFCSPLOWO2_01_FULL_47_25]OGL85765.1 MAG: tRNA-
MPQITWRDFEKIEFRVGTIIEAKDFPEARKPAYQLTIDLGPDVGIKKSSVQITHLYKKDELIGRQVLCVCNFPPKRIANFQSEILTCGFYLPTGEVVLTIPEKRVPNGSALA